MIGALTNHVWQSTLLAAAMAILTATFRKNRAEVRYWLWFSASFKFFVPFSLLMNLGTHLASAPTAKNMPPSSVSITMEQITKPFPQALRSTPSAPGAAADWLPVAIITVWICGFGAVVLMRFREWLRIRALLPSSSHLDIPAPVELRSSRGLLEPGVIGFFGSVILLPHAVLAHLTPLQLKALLAHELCHIRRRDNLTSAIHMIAEAIFWFHPLVWWIGAQLLQERERACDEAVVRSGNDPSVYAEAILNVCKSYMESPLFCVSGVTGSNINKRIQAILTGPVACDLNLARKMALAVAATTALAMPIVIGVMNAPLVQAQPQPSTTQSLAPGTPKFEVASIRPCSAFRKSKPQNQSPDRLDTGCVTVDRAIQEAYGLFANGHLNPLATVTISGGPAWVHSNLYEIHAKAAGPQTKGTIDGPMLQLLLEDRFKLKVHRETREVSVYALTVGRRGPKLKPFQEGSCIPFDADHPAPLPPPGQPFPRVCGMSRVINDGFDAPGVTLADFATLLSDRLDRPMIDRTGIAGKFDIHLDLSAADLGYPTPRPSDAAEPATPADASDILAAVRSAVQKLGLKLESAKGPGEFLVIDHIEKPSAN